MSLLNKHKKGFIAAAVILVLVIALVLLSHRKVQDFHKKYADANLTKEIAGVERTGTYDRYLASHDASKTPSVDIPVDIYNYKGEGDIQVVENYYGEPKALFTGTGSTVTWNVNVPSEGFYRIYLEYLADDSRGVATERSVTINGEIPFDDAANVEFTRIWTDGGPIRVDNQGNEIRPTQVEIFDWQNAYFSDDRGYVADPYLFWFEKGDNELTLGAENEPMGIRRVEIRGVQSLPTYSEYIAGKEKRIVSFQEFILKIGLL